METASEIERKLLGMPVAERERIAVAVWESLLIDPVAVSDESIDPKAIELAEYRDRDIESGTSRPLTHAEFRQVTGGDE
jgi:hypothetical protein